MLRCRLRSDLVPLGCVRATHEHACMHETLPVVLQHCCRCGDIRAMFCLWFTQQIRLCCRQCKHLVLQEARLLPARLHLGRIFIS